MRGPGADVIHSSISKSPSELPKAGNRTAADGLMDADGLTRMIVDEIDLRKPEQDGHPAADLVIHLRTAANNLFRGNPVDTFDPRPHELDTAAGDDIGFETVRAQIGESFEHGLIDHLGVWPACLRMSHYANPVGDDGRELFGRVANVAPTSARAARARRSRPAPSCRRRAPP